MKNMSCEELQKEYNKIIEMLKNSFILYSHEISMYKLEKEKRNASIMAYKKKVSEQLKELQKKVDSYERFIHHYKKENLELKKENFLLKKKFKKAASSFTKRKEDNLIYRYFNDELEIENFVSYTIEQMLETEFKSKDVKPLYFRKELDNLLKIYIIKALVNRIKIEKIAILLVSILLNKFRHKIYLFVASFFVSRIENEKYSEFLRILLTKTLVEKDKKYEPIKMKYSVDDIKLIYAKYKKVSFKKDDLFTKIDLGKIDEGIDNYKRKIKQNEKKLENLTNEENDILVKLTNSEDDEEKEKIKKELENIDIKKRRIIDNISKLQKELEELENKKLFLEPVNEVAFDNSLEEYEKEIVQKYENVLNEFALALEKGLK
jgi:hypothetical protein